MAITTTTAFEPHAAALRDCIERDVDARYEMVCDDGSITRYAARHYLAFDAHECPLHAMAMATAEGWIWDLGAGAGRHSLILQHLGNDVLAIDRSPTCIELMRGRGVEHTACCTIQELFYGQADTLLLLDHGLGMAGTMDRVPLILRQLRARMKVGGSLWVDGSDGRGRAFLRRGYAELNAHLRYGELTGAPFRWVYLSQRALVQAAGEVGLHCAFVVGMRNGPYLARLQRLS